MKTKIYSINGCEFSYSLHQLYEEYSKDFDKADFLLFAFHSSFDENEVNKEIKEIFKTDNFLAFNAVDSFANDTIISNGVSLCAIEFERKGKINTFYIEDINEINSLEKTAEYLNNNKDKFHIFIAGFCNGNISVFTQKLAKKLNYSPINNIIGGISSAEMGQGELKTYQYIDDKIIKNGFVILSFANVDFAAGVSFGFDAYGIRYKVNKAVGNKLYNIDDGKSASYMTMKLLDNIQTDDTRYLWYAPFAVLSEERGYVKHYRTIADIKDNYIELFGPVEEGEFFKLSFALDEDLIKEDKRVARKLKNKISSPEIAFNFSCIARQYVLEDNQAKEAKSYIDILGTNLFGFFTFGEIGIDNKHKDLTFHNETSLVAALKERE